MLTGVVGHDRGCRRPLLLARRLFLPNEFKRTNSQSMRLARGTIRGNGSPHWTARFKFFGPRKKTATFLVRSDLPNWSGLRRIGQRPPAPPTRRAAFSDEWETTLHRAPKLD